MVLRPLKEELLVLGHTPQLAAILDRPPLETDANFAPFFSHLEQLMRKVTSLCVKALQ